MTETLASPPDTSMVAQIAAMQDYDRYRDLAWEGSFEEYLAMVRDRPQVTRNAFQRVYDMVISYGTEEYIDNKKKLIRYNFFRDEIDEGKDAIFGLDITADAADERAQGRLRRLRPRAPRHLAARSGRLEQEHHRASAQEGSRALLHHARRRAIHLQMGQPGRAWAWPRPRPTRSTRPMHEEPLRAHPARMARKSRFASSTLSNDKFRVKVEGEMDPASRFIFNGLLLEVPGRLGQARSSTTSA